jgi:hypothetical protein
MQKAYISFVALLVLLGHLSAPSTAVADPGFRGSGGHGGAFHAHRHSVPRHGHRGHGFHAPGHLVHKHGHGFHKHPPRQHFVTFGFALPPVVFFSSPPLFHASPLSYSAAVIPQPVYAPFPQPVYAPPMYAPAPPAPPPPRVVEYPTGRYELRGDGINTPYTWVWIPKPPPPPAAPPPDAAPPAAPMSGDGSRPRRTEVYRWVDEEGVIHWTDRWETVPPRLREGAKRRLPS